MSAVPSTSDDLVKARSLCDTLMRRAASLEKEAMETANYLRECSGTLWKQSMSIQRQCESMKNLLRREIDLNPET